jgi:nucleoside 2-deoxyribosyltransferase
MKFYVAGRFHHQDKVKQVMSEIRDEGHNITEDWTEHRSISPYSENPEISLEYASADIEGVKNADVFVLLANKDGRGAHTELGVALANGIKTFVIGDLREDCMFYFHPDVKRRKGIAEVLEEI